MELLFYYYANKFSFPRLVSVEKLAPLKFAPFNAQGGGFVRKVGDPPNVFVNLNFHPHLEKIGPFG